VDTDHGRPSPRHCDIRECTHRNSRSGSLPRDVPEGRAHGKAGPQGPRDPLYRADKAVILPSSRLSARMGRLLKMAPHECLDRLAVTCAMIDDLIDLPHHAHSSLLVFQVGRVDADCISR